MHWLDLKKKVTPLGRVLRLTFDGFLDDRGPRMGAALAYYTLFSLGPLLLIVVSVAGLVWGGEAVRGELVDQLEGLLGPTGAATIEGMLKSVAWPVGGWFSTLLGLGLMLVGATTVFAELQDALDTIWRVPARISRTCGSSTRNLGNGPTCSSGIREPKPSTWRLAGPCATRRDRASRSSGRPRRFGSTGLRSTSSSPSSASSMH